MNNISVTCPPVKVKSNQSLSFKGAQKPQKSRFDDLFKSSQLLLDKKKAKNNPVVVDAIDRLYEKVVKNSESLPTEAVFESYEKNPLNNSYGADNETARVLKVKVKLDDNTFVLLGQDRGVTKEAGYGSLIKAPEAFIKVVDKTGKPKTKAEMYYASSFGAQPRFGIVGKLVPMYRHYDKKLLKIAEKLCAEPIGERVKKEPRWELRPEDLDTTKRLEVDTSGSLFSVEHIHLNKGEEVKDPVIASAISEVYNRVVKHHEELPVSDVYQSYTRNPLSSPHKADNKKAMVLSKRIDLDDYRYVLIGIDRGVVVKNDLGQKVKAPEAFLKYIDTTGKDKPKSEVYAASSYGSMAGLTKGHPMYSDYSKMLLKVAQKVCD